MFNTFRESKNRPTVAVGAKVSSPLDPGSVEPNRNVKEGITEKEAVCSINAAMKRRLENLKKENPTDPSVKVLEIALGMRCKYRPIHDVIVRLSSEMKDRKEIAGKDGEYITLFSDVEYNKWHKVMTHGEVVGIPAKLPADVLYFKNPGSPAPNQYMTSDDVEGMAGAYNPAKRDQVINRIRVNNGLHTPEFETLKGKSIDIRFQDKVYFNYLAIGDENFLGYDKSGKLLYKIKYSELFCRVRSGKITMLNGNCLVKPYFGEGFKETDVDGKTVQAKTIQAGNTELVTELADRPLYLQGILKHIGPPVGELSRTDCKPGDRIIYATASDYEEEIEGETYFVMKQWDLLSKIKDHGEGKEELIPVGDYISIQTQQQIKTQIILRDHDLEGLVPDKGNVLHTGSEVQELKAGDFIHYDRGHGSHLPMKEFGVTLIRECAVMCKGH
jgi:co-chaperonin GroES (HSP10)